MYVSFSQIVFGIRECKSSWKSVLKLEHLSKILMSNFQGKKTPKQKSQKYKEQN